MKSLWPLVLGISGPSKAGKTTLIESLLPILLSYSLKIAVLKRHSHHSELDTPGKDSYRFYLAKADSVLHDGSQILYRFQEKNSLEQVLRIIPSYYDLIFVEGNKKALIPKIWMEKDCPLSSEYQILASLAREEQTVEKALPILFQWMEKAWKTLPLGIAFVYKNHYSLLRPSLFPFAKKCARQVAVVSDLKFIIDYDDKVMWLPFMPGLPFPLCAIFPLFSYFPKYRWLIFYEDSLYQEKDIIDLFSEVKVGTWFIEKEGMGLYYPQIFHIWDKVLRDCPEEANKDAWARKIPEFMKQ